MTEKIQVAVRVQPVKQEDTENLIHWGCEQGMVFQLQPTTKKRIGNPYLFNNVFGSETRNDKIYESIVQPLIDSAMDGFNTSILAYGEETSGKTHTMMGNKDELGIVQLAVDRIFDLIEKNTERAYLLRCSYYTIFRETISDLLDPSYAQYRTNLLNLHHPSLEVEEEDDHCHIVDLTETYVNTPRAVLELIEQGNKIRKVDRNDSCNEVHPAGKSIQRMMLEQRSFKSHTIFRIIVESVPLVKADQDKSAVIVSHINFVDLAGSNGSLLNLHDLIGKLSKEEGSIYPQYSILNEILRDLIGNNARTTFICSIKPAVLHETASTLKFASSAQTVSNCPHVNEVHYNQSVLWKKYNTNWRQLVVSSCNARAVGQSETSLTSQQNLGRTTCNESRENEIIYKPSVLKDPPLGQKIFTELIELDCSSEASENESSPIGVPTLITHPVVSDHSIGAFHLGERVMVTSSQGSISSAIIAPVSIPGLGQQGATDSLGEKASTLASGQRAALQTLETADEPFLSSNMYATGRNGCMGRNGCAQLPTYLLSCPHKMAGRKMCSKCLIRIPDEMCGCENEDFDIIRPNLVEIYESD